MKKLRVFRIIFLVCFFGTLMGAGASITGPAEPTEFQIKAAFIYNFVKFVEWPRHVFLTEDSPISLCVLGQDSLGESLESLVGKTAQGRRLSVRHIGRPVEADRCQILYISKSEKEQIGNVIKGIKSSILTIGDVKNFPSSGGIINFVTSENRISFEINVDAAERAGLKISSQLLRLAKIVREMHRREERQ